MYSLASAHEAHQSAITSVQFSPISNSPYILTSSKDRTVKLWNAKQAINPPNQARHADEDGNQISETSCRPTLVHTYDGLHGYDVLSCALSRDAHQLATCGSDRTVCVLDTETGQLMRRFARLHSQRVQCVAFDQSKPQQQQQQTSHFGGQLLLTGGDDCRVCISDLRCSAKSSQSLIQTMNDARDAITSVAFINAPGGSHQLSLAKSATNPIHNNSHPCVLTSSLDGSIRMYDLRRATQCRLTLPTGVAQCKATHDSLSLLAQCGDGVMRLLDPTDGLCLQQYENRRGDSQPINRDSHIQNVNSSASDTGAAIQCALQHDDRCCITGGSHHHLTIHDLESGAIRQTLRHVSTKEFNQHQLHQSSAPLDSMRSIGLSETAPHDRLVVNALASHSSRECLLSGAQDGSICIWTAHEEAQRNAQEQAASDH